MLAAFISLNVLYFLFLSDNRFSLGACKETHKLDVDYSVDDSSLKEVGPFYNAVVVTDAQGNTLAVPEK